MNRKRMVALLAVTAASFLGILAAYAATVGEFGTPPRLVTYTGYLDQDGVAVTGTVPMSFFITKNTTDGLAAALWREDHTGANAVQVISGRFAADLGRITALPDTLWTGNSQLFVGVSIENIELSGRQRITSAAQAITAAQAKSFNITGALAVQGATTLKDTSVTGALTVNGPLTASGSNAMIQGIRMSRNWANAPSTATESEISNDSEGYKSLMLVGNNSSGTRKVSVWDRLEVNGTSHTTGAATAGSVSAGTVTVSGRLNVPAGAWNTEITVHDGFWGGWTGHAYCPANTYVCGFRARIEGDQGGGDDTALNAIRLVCCTFGS